MPPPVLTTPTPSATSVATSSPTAALLDPASWIQFSSVRHGYTIRHPPDWTATAGTAPWPPGSIALPQGPSLDRLEGQGVLVGAESQELPDGVDGPAWMASYITLLQAAHPTCGRPLEAWEPLEIDGQAGLMVVTCEMFALVVTDGRGYEFRMFESEDVDLYLALLGTVNLEPERAAEGSGAPS